MKKLLSLALLFFGTASAFAQTSSASLDPNAPVMEFKTETIEFGTITQGEKVTREYVFTNNGKQPLIITNVLVTCGCTDPEYPKTPILPGKTGTIKVTFNSDGKLGIQDKAITVQSNNRDGDVVLHLKGEIKAPAAASTVKRDDAAPKAAPAVSSTPKTPATTKPTTTSKPAAKKPVTSPQKPKAVTNAPASTVAKPKK